MAKDSNSRLVYSTASGRIKQDPKPSTVREDVSDGIIRLHRETKGRKGKGVTVVRGFNLPSEELKSLAKQLKQHCGTGGTVKDQQVEIQGDHRTSLKLFLEGKGFQVKLSGA